MKVLNKELIINMYYYIKKTIFVSEDLETIELISLTKETTANVDGRMVVTPEILASSFRELPFRADEEFSEKKVTIAEEQALKLAELESDQEAFLSYIEEII